MRISTILVTWALTAALVAACGASKKQESASEPAKREHPGSAMGEHAGKPMEPAAAEAADGPTICGRIELAPGLASKFKPGTTLFVFAKPQLGAGPPVAVRRYAPDGFPFPFCLSQKNTMVQGLKFEGKVYVTARLDVDASGVSVSTGDLEGVTKAPVEVGTQDLVLTIDTTK